MLILDTVGVVSCFNQILPLRVGTWHLISTSPHPLPDTATINVSAIFVVLYQPKLAEEMLEMHLCW